MKKLIKRLYSNTSNVLHLTPFPVSPMGEMLKMSPSPVGEGWEGGNKINYDNF
jgi:hypothetical protein